MSRRGVVAAFVAVLIASIATMGRSTAVADPCTDVDATVNPECLPDGTAGHLVRQACFYEWVEEICGPLRFDDPGYRTTTDPSPDGTLRLRVGAVHEHSSYSDGDPHSIPADYFKAASTGHNTADAGGDSGVKLDFMFASEHSDNTQIPITTAAVCADPTHPDFILACGQFEEQDHYAKWPASLDQAKAATTSAFTAVRGFEWTNDVYNHMNVYFSTNFTNVKVDGSYVTMDVMWDWLRRPASQGGGADALVTFNHPGRQPSLTPFDEGLIHGELLASMGGANWNEVAYVPDVDANVAGMEVNGGDDIEYYVKGLSNGWHIGAVANEDEHEREWASSGEDKTLILTRGRSAKDYYYAFSQHRTIAIDGSVVGGAPGDRATFPSLRYFANAPSIHDPKAVLLGSTIKKSGVQTLRFQATDLPAGSRVALVSDASGGLATPVQLGKAAADGTFSASRFAISPRTGEDWYFVVVCGPTGSAPCGSDGNHTAVTAPIWLSSP